MISACVCVCVCVCVSQAAILGWEVHQSCVTSSKLTSSPTVSVLHPPVQPLGSLEGKQNLSG